MDYLFYKLSMQNAKFTNQNLQLPTRIRSRQRRYSTSHIAFHTIEVWAMILAVHLARGRIAINSTRLYTFSLHVYPVHPQIFLYNPRGWPKATHQAT